MTAVALAPRRVARRFQPIAPDPGAVRPLAADHPAVIAGRTVFPSRVTDPTPYPVLKSGQNNRKIGKTVLKGRLAGAPIYTLTLEERATCPRSCQHWRDCYGNNMHHSPRHRAGPGLELRLKLEVGDLARKHPGGFLVRLHILGDFYSVDYADLWAGLLHRHKALNIFGFTAHPPSSEIGAYIAQIRAAAAGRFMIRHSGRTGEMGAFTLPMRPSRPTVGDAVVCPEQFASLTDGRESACATCALCWQSEKPIVFVEH